MFLPHRIYVQCALLKYINTTADTGVCVLCSGSNCTSCPAGFYLSDVECLACNTGCATCDVNGNCLTCSPGYKLSSTICVPCTATSGPSDCNCALGTFWKSQCVPCSVGCNVCTTVTACITCKPKYYMDNNLCVRSADPNCLVVYAGVPNSKNQATGVCQSCIPTSYYDSVNRICISCTIQPFCQACVLPKICASCITGYYLANSTNCTICPSNLTNCNSCSNATQCDICALGYFWNTTVRNCTACPTACQSCSQNGCLTCLRGYYLNTDINLCYACQSGCSFCINSTNCTTCDSKFYFDTGTKQCTPCHPSCSACNYTGYNNCTACIVNSTLTAVTNGVGTCTCNIGTTLCDITNTCLTPAAIALVQAQYIAQSTYPASSSYIVTGIITFGIILFFIL